MRRGPRNPWSPCSRSISTVRQMPVAASNGRPRGSVIQLDGEYYGDEWTRIDLHSEHATRPAYTAEVSGEAALDGAGHATLRCDAPFKDPGNRAHCSVICKVDVTGPDGQTLTGGTTQDVAMAPASLGVKRGESKRRDRVSWTRRKNLQKLRSGDVQLYRVQTESVRNALRPMIIDTGISTSTSLSRNASG